MTYISLLSFLDLWAKNQEDANYQTAMATNETQRHSVSQLQLHRLTMTKAGNVGCLK